MLFSIKLNPYRSFITIPVILLNHVHIFDSLHQSIEYHSFEKYVSVLCFLFYQNPIKYHLYQITNIYNYSVFLIPGRHIILKKHKNDNKNTIYFIDNSDQKDIFNLYIF